MSASIQYLLPSSVKIIRAIQLIEPDVKAENGQFVVKLARKSNTELQHALRNVQIAMGTIQKQIPEPAPKVSRLSRVTANLRQRFRRQSPAPLSDSERPWVLYRVNTEFSGTPVFVNGTFNCFVGLAKFSGTVRFVRCTIESGRIQIDPEVNEPLENTHFVDHEHGIWILVDEDGLIPDVPRFPYAWFEIDAPYQRRYKPVMRDMVSPAVAKISGAADEWVNVELKIKNKFEYAVDSKSKICPIRSPMTECWILGRERFPQVDLMISVEQWTIVGSLMDFPDGGFPVQIAESFHYIALWYKDGMPLFGRAFPNDAGKLIAQFGVEDSELAPENGLLYLLKTIPPENMDMTYKWVAFKERTAGGFHPVQVADCSPCILKDDKGVEHLGNVHLGLGKASAGVGGKEITISGAALENLLVLVRSP